MNMAGNSAFRAPQCLFRMTLIASSVFCLERAAMMVAERQPPDECAYSQFSPAAPLRLFSAGAK